MLIILGMCVFAPRTAQALRLETGRVTTSDTFSTSAFTPVTFQHSFDSVPVVISLATTAGSDPSALRIRNVTTSGFDVIAVEPPGNDGPHVAMEIDYVAMEPGIIVLPGGETIIAGRQSVTAIQAHSSVGVTRSWATLPLGAELSSTANVIASLQTTNSESGNVPGAPSEPFLTVALRNTTSSSVQIALERSEVAAGTVVAEDVGWIAFPNGTAGDFITESGDVINWESRRTSDTIVGFDDQCTLHTFASSTFSNARLIATKITRFGNNGGWLRRCNQTSTQIGLLVDEDIANDPERNHVGEVASILAFSDSFHIDFESLVTASKQVEILEDPVTGDTAPFALPGARIRYTITAESRGNISVDTDTVIIVDAISDDLALIVDDIAGTGSGPIQFTNGTLDSQLTYSYGGFADTTDDVDFSNDGGNTFSYVPDPDPDGTDSAITHIRVTPKGAFDAASAAGAPSFEIAFDTMVL